MADKTPGEVAWEAYRSALVETPGQPVTGGYTSPAWEAAATAVRRQLKLELDAEIGIVAAEPGKVMRLIGEIAVEDIVRVQDIRKVLREWHAQSWRRNTEFWCDYMIHYDALQDIAKLVGFSTSDEPKPESAEACAEDAGAEQSKSPPPAER